MAASRENVLPVDFTKTIDRSVLRGRTALVTGAGSGIGLAIATALAESGANVTLADLNEANGSAAAEAFKSQGKTAQFIKVDVRSWDDQVAAFALAAKASPNSTVDIVVTAAGMRPVEMPHPSHQTSPTKPNTSTLEVNLIGTYYTMTLAHWYFTHCPPDPSKQILFIGSTAGYGPSQRNSMAFEYTASKYGVRGLWQHLRRQDEFTNGQARTNLLAPFFIDTPMLTRAEVDVLRAHGAKVGTLQDVVEGAMRCLCDGEISGRALAVCGGEANGGLPGSANFDLDDELKGFMGGKALAEGMGKMFAPRRPA